MDFGGQILKLPTFFHTSQKLAFRICNIILLLVFETNGNQSKIFLLAAFNQCKLKRILLSSFANIMRERKIGCNWPLDMLEKLSMNDAHCQTLAFYILKGLLLLVVCISKTDSEWKLQRNWMQMKERFFFSFEFCHIRPNNFDQNALLRWRILVKAENSLNFREVFFGPSPLTIASKNQRIISSPCSL